MSEGGEGERNEEGRGGEEDATKRSKEAEIDGMNT